MPKLIIQDQLKIKQPKVIPIDCGVSADQALRDNFDEINITKTKFYINDVLALPTDSIFNNPLQDGDSLTVIQEVKGGVIGDVLSFATLGLSDKILDVVTGLFAPDVPEFDTAQTSPNNSFSGQSNIIRAYSQKPLVCGSPRIYPDLIGESIEYFNNNIKYSESYFFAAHGTFSGGSVQAGDTLVGRFAGAVSTRYLPDSVTKIATVPDYRVGNEVQEAAGQTLEGTNQGQDGASFDCDQGASATVYSGTTFTLKIVEDANSDNLKASFDSGNVEFELSYIAYKTLEPGGNPERITTNGTGTMTSMTLSSGQYTVVLENFNGIKSETIYDSPYLFTEKLDNTLGPFVNPAECEKMFFNIRFDRGLKSTVPIKVTVYELDAKGGSRTGVTQSFTATYTADTLDEVLRTFEINISNGESWYEWTIQRTNQASEDTQEPDIASLEKAYCIKEYGDYDFANGTMLKSIMTAEQTAGSGGVDNKINIIDGQTEMPSYNKATGAILPNAPSRIAADAVMFVWRDFYGLDLDVLNLDELYTISDSLPESMKTFDYTFDDTSTSVGDVLDIILDVMRVQRYWDGTQVRFWRDEATSIDSAFLSRVDFAPESERNYSLSRTSFVTGQYDSVQIEYVDRSINKKAYIYRSIDGSGNIVNVAGQNPLSKELTGCQSETNATNRAELEIRRLLYQRWSLSDTLIDSHRFLEKGNVVQYNEVYEGGNAWGGEIQDVNGATATVRETLELDSGTSYQVIYTNLEGDVVGPYPIVSSTANTFTCTDLSEAYIMGFERSQLGSRYYITEVNDTINRRYRVMERTSSDYNVQVSMVGYDERIYEYDTI